MINKLAIHWRILLGIVFGIGFGLISDFFEFQYFIKSWISPFGVIFINLLKMIAVPIVLVSIVKSVTDFKSFENFAQLSKNALVAFVFTTIIAVSTGLIIVNLIKPGNFIDDASKIELMNTFNKDISEKINSVSKQKDISILSPIIDAVPSNIFMAFSDNSKMLQVIFFALLIGFSIMKINSTETKPVVDFFNGLYPILMQVIDLIMLFAPFGIFALMATLMTEIPNFSVLKGILIYGFTVSAGLFIHTFIFYPFLVFVLTKKNPIPVFKKMIPFQLLAFSTSSSAATLPLTMERTVEHIGVDEDIASFILPLGATVNMDGTSLYQGVAAVFIAQALNIPLNFEAQLMILFTATLASIGAAAVPSAGLLMLIIVLGQVGIPEAGLALIFALDRPLDMLRTTTNVTGDVTISYILAERMGKINHIKLLENTDN
jgi:proton glutamate symport protein